MLLFVANLIFELCCVGILVFSLVFVVFAKYRKYTTEPVYSSGRVVIKSMSDFLKYLDDSRWASFYDRR